MSVGGGYWNTVKTLPVGSVVYGGGLELGWSERGDAMKTEQEIRIKLAALKLQYSDPNQTDDMDASVVAQMEVLRWVLGE